MTTILEYGICVLHSIAKKGVGAAQGALPGLKQATTRWSQAITDALPAHKGAALAAVLLSTSYCLSALYYCCAVTGSTF
jgi:hypothetical protein